MRSLGITLPKAPTPVGLFVPVNQVDHMLYASGQGSFFGEHRIEGKVGRTSHWRTPGWAPATVCSTPWPCWKNTWEI